MRGTRRSGSGTVGRIGTSAGGAPRQGPRGVKAFYYAASLITTKYLKPWQAPRFDRVVCLKSIHSMASNAPPAYAESSDQPLANDAPPIYDEATGTLDVNQHGLSAQTQITS